MKNSGFIDRVTQTIAKHSMLLPGERVGVAVSGGPDSVCLLHILSELIVRLNITLGVIHLNHQLRGSESDRDAKFVVDLAHRLGLEMNLKSFPVAAIAKEKGENLEQAARTVRYEFFTNLVDDSQYDKVAVGHTRSDQAETVLFRLLRGAGSAGLSGVRPKLTSQVVRPLIEHTRDEVMAYLTSNNHAYRLDSTNFDTAHARNRLRHNLLPQLQRDWNPNVVNTLANTAEWARAEEEEWDTRLQPLEQSHLMLTEYGLSFRVDSIKTLSLATIRRLLRRAIKNVRGDLLGISFTHIESLRQLTETPKGTGSLDLPGMHAERSFGEIHLRPTKLPSTGRALYRVNVDAPGCFSGPWGGFSLTLKLHHREVSSSKQGYNGDWRGLLDWEKVPRPLYLRNWRAGDSYRPVGRSGVKKLKSLFQEKQVAIWHRETWPVLVCAARTDQTDTTQIGEDVEEIVWSRTFGPSSRFSAAKNSRILLEIRETV